MKRWFEHTYPLAELSSAHFPQWLRSGLRILKTFPFFASLLCVPASNGQGAAPETAPPLFPGGELVSYSSNFTTRGLMPESSGNIPTTARPSFAHEGEFNFTWGFYRNFDLTILIPVITNHLEMGALTVGGTGLGDAMALVKYRFYRRDSQRGTTQASVTVGPKIPTGRTDLRGANGILLPATLQPGSGSTDFLTRYTTDSSRKQHRIPLLALVQTL